MAVYKESDLVKVAARENNTKRSYLLVNPMQGKHIPAKPKKILEVFKALTQRIQKVIGKQKKVLLIGFAETATAIGASVAANLEGEVWYIQTTREQEENAEYLYFSEVHSHAVQQKIRKEKLRECLSLADWVIFLDDEVTTGNTIRNLIKKLEEETQKTQNYLIASLLNGMDQIVENTFISEGILCSYLIKTKNQELAKQLENYQLDGTVKRVAQRDFKDSNSLESSFMEESKFVEPSIFTKMKLNHEQEPRNLVIAKEYQTECSLLSKKIVEQVIEEIYHFKDETLKTKFLNKTCNMLVLGTEECMYQGIITANYFEQNFEIDVLFHATTRSPIAVSENKEYPLFVRYELDSFYEADRRTYLYNLKVYDLVLVITDAKELYNGYESLQKALLDAGNHRIILVQV